MEEQERGKKEEGKREGGRKGGVSCVALLSGHDIVIANIPSWKERLMKPHLSLRSYRQLMGCWGRERNVFFGGVAPGKLLELALDSGDQGVSSCWRTAGLACQSS